MGTNNRIEKIAILTDTGSYLSPKIGKMLGVWVLPLQIIEKNNGETICYDDLVDIHTSEVNQKIYQDFELTTSQPLLATIYDVITEIKEKGYTSIIAVPLTSGISSTSSTIQSVANELDIPISVVDVYTTCQLQQYIVKEAKRMVDLQYSREEIASQLERLIDNSNTYLLVKDINHLKKGGRLTPLAATLANILKIYPILTMNSTTQGKIDVFDKVRTEKKTRRVIVNESVENISNGDYLVYILHSDDFETAKYLKSELINKGIAEERVHIDDLNSVIAVHVGMKALAIQYIENLEE